MPLLAFAPWWGICSKINAAATKQPGHTVLPGFGAHRGAFFWKTENIEDPGRAHRDGGHRACHIVTGQGLNSDGESECSFHGLQHAMQGCDRVMCGACLKMLRQRGEFWLKGRDLDAAAPQ